VVVGCAGPARGQPLTKATDAIVSTAESTKESVAEFIDRLPNLLDLGLPGFAEPGALRLYTNPKFGDLLHESYFRLPVGARLKVNDQLELNAELDSYFTHGLRHNVGNGLYQGQVGARVERELWSDIGSSTGIEFVSALGRPPPGITDGLRHTLPYVTLTRPLLTRVKTIAFVTVGADLIDHTAQPVYFRKNELEANSLLLTVGAAREWRRMHVMMQMTEGSTALLSHLHQNSIGFRPSLGIPVLRRPDGTPRATATFEGRAVWGPDGFETGITTSVRFDLEYQKRHRQQ